MINPSLEQINIVVIGATACWESVQQNRGSQEEASPIELISQQSNTDRMWVVFSYVNDAGVFLP